MNSQQYALGYFYNYLYKMEFNIGATWIFGTGYPVTLAQEHYPSFFSMTRPQNNYYNPLNWDEEPYG